MNKFEDVTITQELDSTELDGDEEANVLIRVKNNRLVDLKDVQVKDIIDSRFKVEGVHSRNVNIKSGEEIDAYQYQLIAPRLFQEDNLRINTTVTYYDTDNSTLITLSKGGTIKVVEKTLDLTTSSTTEDTEPYVGDIIDVDYSITNSEDVEAIKDLTLYFPIQEEFELVGPRTYNIANINPGETVEVKGKHKVRPKYNESFQLDDTMIVYHDIYDTVMHENVTGITVDAGNSDVIEPLIYAGIEAPKQANKSEPTKVIVRVSNKGREAAEVKLNNSGEIMTVKVPGRSQRLVEFAKTFNELGNKVINPLGIEYTYQDYQFRSLSSEGSTTVIEKPALFTEVKEFVPEPETAPTEITEEVQEERGVSARFLVEVGIILIIVIAIAGYLIYATRGSAAPPILEE